MIRSIIQPRNNLRENVGETRFLHDKQTAVDHFSHTVIFINLIINKAKRELYACSPEED